MSVGGARELTPLEELSGGFVSQEIVARTKEDYLIALSALSIVYKVKTKSIIATALKRYWQSLGSSQWKSSTAKTPGSITTKTQSRKNGSSKERNCYNRS